MRAAAAGVDLASVTADLAAPLSHQRYRVMAQRASEFCADVRALGSLLLQALERRDEGALALLRSTHQVELLTVLRDIKVKAKEEAEHGKSALLDRKAMAEMRHRHYAETVRRSLSGEVTGVSLNTAEEAGLVLLATSTFLHGIAILVQATSTVAHGTPQVQAGAAGAGGSAFATVEHGGRSVGEATGSAAEVLLQTAGLADKGAELTHTIASYMRREEEWNLQRDLAEKEIAEVDKQLLAADVRIALAEAELRGHDTQTQQARSETEFLKFALHQQGTLRLDGLRAVRALLPELPDGP